LTSNFTNTPQQQNPSQPKIKLWLVILVLALVIIGATIYIAVSENRTHYDSSPKSSLVDEVLLNADVFLDMEQFAAARDLLASYEKSHPGNIEVQTALARAYLGLSEPDKADSLIEAVLARSPQWAEALWVKGEIIRLQGKADYMDYFRAAAESQIGTSPRIWSMYGLELLERKDFEIAGEYLQRAVLAGHEDFLTLRALGGVLLRQKKYSQAAEFLSKAVKKYNKEPRVWAMLAEAQKNEGKFSQAESTLERALELKRDAFLLYMLGDVKLLLGNTQEAAALYAEVTDDPQYRAFASFKAARCNYLLGKYELANRYIDISSELQPGNKDVATWKRKIASALVQTIE